MGWDRMERVRRQGKGRERCKRQGGASKDKKLKKGVFLKD